MYLLTLNCGSSSIKGKLYHLPSPSSPLEHAARVAVSNIGASGDQVRVKIDWEEKSKGKGGGRGGEKGQGKGGKDGKRVNVDEEMGDGGKVEHRDCFPVILKHISASGVSKAEIKYITHRIVHGGMNKKGLVVTKEHSEALEQMDDLSSFAPLHNHHAILCVRACLDALPDSTQLLYFDTMFHQTLAPEVYTYALPTPTNDLAIPLRKYGFHGLSYASIVSQVASHQKVSPSSLNLVVAHLGSGASACCILGGKSIDTSMGLTPLEGLVGGTRTGSIDPTAIMHHSPDYADDAGLSGMKVSRGEWVMNKKSGLTALAGTPNFGTITSKAFDGKAKDKEERGKMELAYNVFLDRLMAFVGQYLCKLLAEVEVGDVQLVFAGGIGERSPKLRGDVMDRLKWLGAQVDEKANEEEGGAVKRISEEGSKLRALVVETDEEGWCAHLAREDMEI